MKAWNGFRKGVNLGGWLSQCDYSKERLENFITESDFRQLASWGLDHVRLPMDYNVLETDNGYSAYGFSLVEKAIAWAKKYRLNIVLDLHKTAGFMFDEAAQENGFFSDPALQERFYRLWEQLAERFGRDPDHVAFELLNEVTDPAFGPVWNRIAKECIRRIRAIAPDTVILVGGYHNNSPAAVVDLDPPYDDRVVYNIHCYDPVQFTHQHAYWVSFLDVQHDMSFADCGADAAYFRQLFAEAAAKAKENGTVLYCGEYGVIDHATPEDTLAWYQTIHQVFEEYGISRCAWSYKEMDFGLTDARLDGVRDELIKCL